MEEVLGGSYLLEVFCERVLGLNDGVHLRFLATEVNVVAGGGVRYKVVRQKLCCCYENNEKTEAG